MSDTSYADTENTKIESTDKFLCPSCGGNMIFNPESQNLTCPYCSNKIDILAQNGSIKEYDFDSAEETASQDWGNEKRIIKCESCGAETVVDENNASQFCAFCGSSHIIKNDNSTGITPKALIPFKISKDNAADFFSKWIKSRHFAPNNLKSNHNMDKLSGVYIPFWTYDSKTYSTYRAEKGTYYYETETKWIEEDGERKQVTEQVRKIKWEHTSGTYSKFFDDVLVNASKQVDEKIIRKLDTFNLRELVDYKPEYLSGFLTERYSINLNEGWKSAKNSIDSDVRSGVTQKINADRVRNLNISTSYDNVTYKHILLPLWISAYTYKDKIYHFMINAQTGEVEGDVPVSALKVLLLITFIICIIALVILFLKK